MVRQRKSYTREFKLEAVRLLETSGRGVGELERELGIGAGCLGRWRDAFQEEGEHAFPGHGHMRPEEERMRALEREVTILRQEREILKKQWPSSRTQENEIPVRAGAPRGVSHWPDVPSSGGIVQRILRLAQATGERERDGQSRVG